MNWAEWVVLAAYALLVVELVVLPIPSEASTLQLFSPSEESRTVSVDNALAKARQRRRGIKLLLFLLPTSLCVAMWLVPLVCILVPDAASWLSCRRSTITDVTGAVLVVVGGAVALVSTLQLRRGKRDDSGPPGGLFRFSRNPGLVGMFTTYIGICVVFGSWLLWLGLPLYLINMHVRVRLEEAHLETKHGKLWRDYVASVPRYLGPTQNAPEAPAVDQSRVAAWFDETYTKKGFSYLRPPRAYPIFLQLLGARDGQRVLDVACGPGLLLRAALDRGLDASGVDISKEAISMARKNLPAADARCGPPESSSGARDSHSPRAAS